MLVTTEGKIIVLSNSQGYDDPNKAIVMLKFEAAGTLLWSKWIYPPVLDYVSHAVATPDGGYLLVGYEFKSPQALEYLLMKFDSDGNLQWSGLYGGTGNDLSTAVRITNEGDYLICG